MSLDLTTVLFELVNFGVLMLLLTKFLFRPVRRLVEERRTEIDRARAEVATAAQTTQAVREDYESRRIALEQGTDGLRRAAVEEGEAAAQRIVEQARDQVRRDQAGAEAEVERARRGAIDQLRPQLVRLAVEAGRRVIQDMEAPEIALAHARRAAHQLRDEFVHQGEPASIRVLMSPDADLYAVSLAMREIFGELPVEIHVDEALVGGACISAGKAEVRASAGDSLERWLADAATTDALEASPSVAEAIS